VKTLTIDRAIANTRFSLKTSIDAARYFLGQTDSVKGTGVFKSFELKRDQKEIDERVAKKQKEAEDAATKK
jgi:hypothetical protein